jgi:hypothetical protein
MVIFGGLWDVVTVIFLVLVFAEYAKVKAKISRPTNFIAGAGVLLLLAAGSELLGIVPSAVYWLTTIFSVIAWILLLIGTLWATYELTKAK